MRIKKIEKCKTATIFFEKRSPKQSIYDLFQSEKLGICETAWLLKEN
jgi:hypothetical protein